MGSALMWTPQRTITQQHMQQTVDLKEHREGWWHLGQCLKDRLQLIKNEKRPLDQDYSTKLWWLRGRARSRAGVQQLRNQMTSHRLLCVFKKHATFVLNVTQTQYGSHQLYNGANNPTLLPWVSSHPMTIGDICGGRGKGDYAVSWRNREYCIKYSGITRETKRSESLWCQMVGLHADFGLSEYILH